MLDVPSRSNHTPDAELLDAVRELAAKQPYGHSLIQDFYLSQEIYRLDIERMMFKHWLCVGHESSIKEKGQYFVYDIDKESVIIARGRDGIVRAFMNVCRHRGSRVCYEREGHSKSGLLICPYHAWTFTTEGTLRNAREMPADFDKEGHGLKSVRLAIIEGVIFITLSDAPLSLNQLTDTMTHALEPYGWKDGKVIQQTTYKLKANWKLAIENQMECYHCAPAHPDYTRLHSQARPGVAELTEAMQQRTRDQGIHITSRDQWALKAIPGEEADYRVRYAMWEGIVTGSEDGQSVAPPMGRFTQFDGGVTFVYAGPTSFFLAYTDYGAMFHFVPMSADGTELRVTWIVRSDAEEGKDYDVDKVTWLWRVTNDADKLIIEKTQQGVASRAYQPGPLALPIEESTRRFDEWYLRDLVEG